MSAPDCNSKWKKKHNRNVNMTEMMMIMLVACICYRFCFCLWYFSFIFLSFSFSLAFFFVNGSKMPHGESSWLDPEILSYSFVSPFFVFHPLAKLHNEATSVFISFDFHSLVCRKSEFASLTKRCLQMQLLFADPCNAKFSRYEATQQTLFVLITICLFSLYDNIPYRSLCLLHSSSFMFFSY